MDLIFTFLAIVAGSFVVSLVWNFIRRNNVKYREELLEKTGNGDAIAKLTEALIAQQSIAEEITAAFLPKLKCQNCGVLEETSGVNLRSNSKLCSFKTGEILSDGIEVHATFCFSCFNITEYSADPFNSSGKAVDGIEIYNLRQANRQDIAVAMQFAKEFGLDVAAQKLARALRHV